MQRPKHSWTRSRMCALSAVHPFIKTTAVSCFCECQLCADKRCVTRMFLVEFDPVRLFHQNRRKNKKNSTTEYWHICRYIQLFLKGSLLPCKHGCIVSNQQCLLTWRIDGGSVIGMWLASASGRDNLDSYWYSPKFTGSVDLLFLQQVLVKSPIP